MLRNLRVYNSFASDISMNLLPNMSRLNRDNKQEEIDKINSSQKIRQ